MQILWIKLKNFRIITDILHMFYVPWELVRGCFEEELEKNGPLVQHWFRKIGRLGALVVGQRMVMMELMDFICKC